MFTKLIPERGKTTTTHVATGDSPVESREARLRFPSGMHISVSHHAERASSGELSDFGREAIQHEVSVSLETVKIVKGLPTLGLPDLAVTPS